jgi:hypothetical protein
MEMEMRRTLVSVVLTALLAAPATVPGADAPARLELAHPAGGHEVQVSAPAVAVDADGQPIVAWAAGGHEGNALFVARPGSGGASVRLSPPDLAVDSLHQAPGIAVGRRGEVYVTWSSAKAKASDALFASDLRLSRSLDGGRTFEAPLRLNEDRPTARC